MCGCGCGSSATRRSASRSHCRMASGLGLDPPSRSTRKRLNKPCESGESLRRSRRASSLNTVKMSRTQEGQTGNHEVQARRTIRVLHAVHSNLEFMRHRLSTKSRTRAPGATMAKMSCAQFAPGRPVMQKKQLNETFMPGFPP